MSKKKAIICTILMAIIILSTLTASFFIKNEEIGICLYDIIVNAVFFLSLNGFIKKFYNWLIQ